MKEKQNTNHLIFGINESVNNLHQGWAISPQGHIDFHALGKGPLFLALIYTTKHFGLELLESDQKTLHLNSA